MLKKKNCTILYNNIVFSTAFNYLIIYNRSNIGNIFIWNSFWHHM